MLPLTDILGGLLLSVLVVAAVVVVGRSWDRIRNFFKR
jgi:hypothetical protein